MKMLLSDTWAHLEVSGAGEEHHWVQFSDEEVQMGNSSIMSVNVFNSCPARFLHDYNLRKDFCAHVLLLSLLRRKLVGCVILHRD